MLRHIGACVNFKLLKNHHLKFIYLIGCFAVYGCRLQIAYIPPYARDCGISRRDISYLVTIIRACDFAHCGNEKVINLYSCIWFNIAHLILEPLMQLKFHELE
jgi:hypothetical protein